VGRKRIYADNAAKQADYRVRAQKKQIQRKRQGDYSTPQDLFEAYDRIYHFTLDVCATAANAKCPHYFTPEQDGLQQPWEGAVWMNPPYHKTEIPKWIRKAYEESQRGAVVVALLPVRTGSAWYHELVLPHAKVTFLRGRVKFAGLTTNAMEDSMIAVFGDHRDSAPTTQGQETPRPALAPEAAEALRQDIERLQRVIEEDPRLRVQERDLHYTLGIVLKMIDALSASDRQH
jgi:site-specific DNA-methyltransferase (adenine-specific)